MDDIKKWREEFLAYISGLNLPRDDYRGFVAYMDEALAIKPEPSTGKQEILDYLDTVLHPIISPEHWDVYSELHDMISTLPSAQPEQRWIPCSERLPKYGKNVLITNDKGNVSYGRFRGVEFWKEDGDSYWTWKKNTIEHVLAWMPLPEPYRGEAE